MYIGIFFLLLGLLALSSQVLTRAISQVFHATIKHHGISIRLFALLFLPGVILHELSHAVMAYLLLVPVGKMEFLPVADGEHVKLGSVAVGKTDPFRRFLIGVAPVVIGTAIVCAMLYYFMPKDVSLLLEHVWQGILLIYAVFVISNTMFSSRKDLEGSVWLLLFIAVTALVLYAVGVRVPQDVLDFFASDRIQAIFQTGSMFLAIPLGMNIICIVLLQVISRRWRW